MTAEDPYGVPTRYVPRTPSPALTADEQHKIDVDAARWRAFLSQQSDPDAVTADVDTIRGGL